MTYKTTIIKSSFWYNESKKTVQYILKGLSKSEINEKTTQDNTFQVNSISRSRQIANTTYKRMSIFSTDLLEQFIKTDIATAKIIVLFGIMGTDRLFYEFMDEIFKEHKILGENELTRKDVEKFIEYKKIENEIIGQWSDEVFKRIKSTYITFLRDSGLIDEENVIKDIYVDYNVQKILINDGFQNFLDIIQ